jgi:hypothetical protein
MKKAFLFVIIIFLFASCKKDQVTTYQIVNNVSYITPTVEYLDGSIYEIVVFHYKGSDITKQDNITKVASGGGKSEVIEVPATTEKIKVSFKFLPAQSSSYSSLSREYIVAYTIIEEGKNNIVTLTNSTMVSTSITKSETQDGYSVVQRIIK